MQPAPAVLQALLEGPLCRLGDAIASEVPTTGAGIYTVWDDRGQLVYVGVAGRNPEGAGLAGRLRSHASGRRSGDQFCVYVADHYVLPELSQEQIRAITDSQLSMAGLVREKIRRSFSFRAVAAPDYATALAVESWIKSGQAPCGRPRLNPS